jgi:hypothetical protein
MSAIQIASGAPRRIGFISTRFYGTDGVTLEARKWARMLNDQGHACYWMAGLLDTPADCSFHVPIAFFCDPQIAELRRVFFVQF